MIVYKLFRLMSDGQLASLFIEKPARRPVGEWMEAEFHPTKGYAERQGWHCCLKPEAPHLSERDRVWAKCEVDDYEFFERPANQGGTWVLAQRLKIMEVLCNVREEPVLV